MSTLSLVAVIILIALLFDYVNGFHDAANSVATVVATRVLTPLQAVGMAAVFNFLAAYFLGTGVAATIGQGFVNTRIVTPHLILAGLMGAVIWNVLTWYMGLPISSSHALIGGYAGAALAKAGFHGLVVGKWPTTLLFIVIAPLMGLALGYGFMLAVYWIFRHFSPAKMDRWFRHLQIVSASLLSCAHGTNDAQKSMGIITAVLVAGGFQKGFHVPDWVILACAAAMGLGTLSGGWRVVRTMGTRLTRLKPRSGFCAETGAAISILFATWLALPVSTTHVVAGAHSRRRLHTTGPSGALECRRRHRDGLGLDNSSVGARLRARILRRPAVRAERLKDGRCSILGPVVISVPSQADFFARFLGWPASRQLVFQQICF